jgi:two-component system, response regulator, stage 0 sporulation protein F
VPGRHISIHHQNLWIMKRILLVDDDVRIQRLLAEELEEDGYRISTARNGKDALSLLTTDSERPDLVILDLRMPKMNGLETIGLMLKLKLNIPVIIFSAYSSYRNDSLAMAADAYVVKSSDLSELKVKIHELA